MQIRLLGPVDVMVAGVARPVAGLRPKAVLAVLGLAAGEAVSTTRLIEVVWDGQPPATGLNTLQRHVSYLRRVLGGRDTIVVRASGYALAPAGHVTDVQAATELIERSRRGTDPAVRLAQLRSALGLWRGVPLSDVSVLPWLERQAERLVALRLDATQEAIEARLALGEHAQLVDELDELTRLHPYREPLHAQLMLALYRCGRQADALAVAQHLRRTLADDLGIDPGAAVRELEAAILRQESSLDRLAPDPVQVSPPRPADVGSVVASPVPRQLPADLAGFTGRERHLADLDALLASAGGSAAVVSAVVSGTAGVGKTALAVHWAHRVADRFPDGHLYVNLRGFDPTAVPMDPLEAVRGFLDAFGVAAHRIPQSQHAQVALYRSVLAGRRVLVVLDNAVGVAQVRPLLPGSSTCLVVVTSRTELTGLVAADGAHPMRLDLLSDDEALRLLQQRLGKDRVDAEPDAVEHIVQRCARLPLALAIVAARAATVAHLPLTALAEELRDSHAVLTAGDPSSDVQAILSWSYRQLSPDAARLFRWLSRHPGPDLTPAAAASLLGVPPRAVGPMLAELSRANLITEHRVGRYAWHDLLDAYAADLAARLDSDEERDAATQRILDHYVHSAYAADQRMQSHRDQLELGPPLPGVTPQRPADHDEAVAWFGAEHAVVLLAIGHAAAAGFDIQAWRLAWSAATFLDRSGRWYDWVSAGRTAVEAAQRLGDVALQAGAVRILSRAYTLLGRFEEARIQLRRALKLYRHAGELAGEGHAHFGLAHSFEQQGRHGEALEHCRQALEVYRKTGHRAGEANALNSVGWLLCLLGEHEAALEPCRQALALFEEIGDTQGLAGTWDSLGHAYHHLGRHAAALECYQTSLRRYRQLGHRYYEAATLNHIGDSYLVTGDRDAAARAWREALSIFADLEHADADELRRKLAQA